MTIFQQSFWACNFFWSFTRGRKYWPNKAKFGKPILDWLQDSSMHAFAHVLRWQNSDLNLWNSIKFGRSSDKTFQFSSDRPEIWRTTTLGHCCWMRVQTGVFGTWEKFRSEKQWYWFLPPKMDCRSLSALYTWLLIRRAVIWTIVSLCVVKSQLKLQNCSWCLGYHLRVGLLPKTAL